MNINDAVKSPETLILHRIGDGDKRAVQECVEKYGSMIWQTAKHYTNSKANAESVTLEIFREIWKCAASFNPENCLERVFVHRIAYRCLLKQKIKDRENP